MAKENNTNPDVTEDILQKIDYSIYPPLDDVYAHIVLGSGDILGIYTKAELDKMDGLEGFYDPNTTDLSSISGYKFDAEMNADMPDIISNWYYYTLLPAVREKLGIK